ncbi:keto reductase [Xylariales sp. PMI_506]|nr:keto reductase [Xylariales sp. PMI_506]
MAEQTKSEVKLVFGAMTLGKTARVSSVEDAGAILDVFQKFGLNEIDTARGYSNGTSEEYLAELKWQERGLVLATKLSPAATPSPISYSHKPADLRRGIQASLDALKTDKLDLWYLHFPDHHTPYEETLREVNNMYKEGLFRRFGISNFPAWQVAQVCDICTHNGWKKPDVYQGLYNALQRNVEVELLPCLKYYGIAFYEYNPLAGGMLTDKYQRDLTKWPTGSRFDPVKGAAHYRARYWNEAYFDALDIIKPVAAKLGISTAEAAFRWARYHSKLRSEAGDAVIVAATSPKQLEDNLRALNNGPLPSEMVQAFDDGWAVARGAAVKPYFRPLPE